MRWPRAIVLVRACSSDLDQTELQQHAAQMLSVRAKQIPRFPSTLS
jgi:hypothetical protein